MTEKLECDLVMRGGITSGIVYPRAIAKLAETYNFRSHRRHVGRRHRRDGDGGCGLCGEKRSGFFSDAHQESSQRACH